MSNLKNLILYAERMVWKPRPPAEDIGAALHEFRTEHGLTLDDVAQAARQFGAEWIAATVRSIEHGGSKADSLGVILLLLNVMNMLHHNQLVERVKTGELSEDDASRLDRIYGLADLLGSQVDLPGGSILSVEAAIITLVPSAKPGRRSLRVMTDPPHEGGSSLLSYISGRLPTAAERRAAKRMNISAAILAKWCQDLYGHSLDEESATRAGGREASPQKRGLATREVLAEVSHAMGEDLRNQLIEGGLISADD